MDENTLIVILILTNVVLLRLLLIGDKAEEKKTDTRPANEK